MKDLFLTNYSDISFLEKLKNCFRKCNSFELSVSFIKNAGLDVKAWDGKNVHINIEGDKVSEIVKLFVKNDVDIDGVVKKEKNLEDIFFNATEKGGKKNENA